jgi:acyl-CoA hydrolase
MLCMTACVCYKVNHDAQVTACLDRLDLLRPVTLCLEDLVLQGQASWAGKSSLQVDVNIMKASSNEEVRERL